MFKVNNRNTRKWCEICSKLTIKNTRTTSMTSFWCFLLLTLNIFPTFFQYFYFPDFERSKCYLDKLQIDSEIFLSVSFPEMKKKYKRSHSFCRIAVLKELIKITGEHVRWSTFLKKLHPTYSIVNLIKVFRITFTQNVSE